MGKLELWIGRTGSGKSQRVAQEIVEAVNQSPIGRPVFWMVPEDIAYFTERRLLGLVPSVLRAEVITMSRFAMRIVQSVRPNLPDSITQTGKRLVLASVYSQYVPLLGPLRRERPTPAFFDTILDSFDEMTREMVDLAQLEGAIQTAAASLTDESSSHVTFRNTAGHSLLGKLRDLSLLYIHYVKELEQTNLRDSSQLMSEAGLFIGSWTQIQGATIYVDGFTMMTPQERTFVTTVAQHAKRTVITLPVDEVHRRLPELMIDDSVARLDLGGHSLPPIVTLLSRLPNSQEVIAPQAVQTFLEICQEAQMSGCDYEIVAFDGKSSAIHEEKSRFVLESDLSHLEQKLFSNTPEVYHTHPENLRRFEATNPQTECLGIAADIKRLITENHSYQSIAVVVPNLSSYTPFLRDAFELYQIPASLEPFPTLASYPLAKFLLACFAAVEDGASTDSMVRLLKTDFSQLSQHEADWFEGYLRMYEIKHLKIWFSETTWTFAEDLTTDERRRGRSVADDERANRFRTRIMEYLAPFSDVVGMLENTPLGLVTAIWRLFESVNAKAIVAKWMVNEDGGQHPFEASIHEQAWQKLMALCNDLASVQPDAHLSQSELFAIVRGDLENQSLASIPAGINEVRVSDLHATHSWDAKHVYVAGLIDKDFPRRVRPQGLLQDEERLMFLRLFGQPLGLTSSELQQAERCHVYFALTRASQTLTLSAPLSSADGREAHPSMILRRVELMFPHGAWRLGQWGVDPVENVTFTETAALSTLLNEIQRLHQGDAPKLLRPLLDYFRSNGSTLQTLQQAVSGFFHHHTSDSLPRDLVRELYGSPLMMNVYQLESFAACPFQHFAQFGLRVKPQETRLVPLTMAGTLRHDVLMGFVRQFQDKPEEWQKMSDEEAMAAIDLHLFDVLAAKHAAAWQREVIRQSYVETIREELHQVAVVLTRNARHGTFYPASVELSFGLDDESSLPMYELDLPSGDKVGLRGRIDRVDGVAVDDSTHFFRIVDYKSRSKKLNELHVTHGLQLQLLVYASVIEEFGQQIFGTSSKASGLLYVPVMHSLELKLTPDDEAQATQKSYQKLRFGGWILADSRVIRAMDERLMNGEASELFPKMLNKDQSYAKSAPLLEQEDWEEVLSHALANVKTLATQVLDGEKSVAPYRLSQTDVACNSCHFKALCHMDAAVDSDRYRRLREVNKHGGH